MGHKGNSIRKPKASSLPVSKANQNSSVGDLVKDKGAPLSKGGANLTGETNKAQKKH